MMVDGAWGVILKGASCACKGNMINTQISAGIILFIVCGFWLIIQPRKYKYHAKVFDHISYSKTHPHHAIHDRNFCMIQIEVSYPILRLFQFQLR